MAKRRVPNVVRGGAAIPLKGKTNYYYMTGRKHIDGGIDIGQNPKTGIEVEDGEVMHITDNEVKVFSSVPFLNGESPAQKVMRGENANKVFNEQEQFKKANNIEDDGSRKKRMGGDEHEINPITGRKVKRIKPKNTNISIAGDKFETITSRLPKHNAKQYNDNINALKRHTAAMVMHLGEKYSNINGNRDALYEAPTMKEAKSNTYKRNVAQNTYLMSKEDQKQAFLNSGYIEGTPGDYGLVRSAVGNRDIPVYQKNKDVIGRDSLTHLGNYLVKNDLDFIQESSKDYNVTSLDNAHSYPVAIYFDKNGKFYFKGWDLNDYGADANGNKGIGYGLLNDKIANVLDKIGNPTVITTGYQDLLYPHNYVREVLSDLYDKDKDKYHEVIKTIKTKDNDIKNLYDDFIAFDIEDKLESILNAEDYSKTMSILPKLTNEEKIQYFSDMFPYNDFVTNIDKYYSKSDQIKQGVYLPDKKVNDNKIKKHMGGKHNINNKELGFSNRGFYSVTDKGKTKYYMIPSTGNSSARSAEGRTKAELGIKLKNWWEDNKSNIISDGIGLVSNIAGGIISHSMNKNMLNKLKPAPQPIARQATKLKTQININPQLDKMRETVAAYERNIDNNTSSSNVALARKQNARLANILNTNELYGTKENIETELINKDRLNQQAVSEKNVTDYNKWSTDVANFRNTVLEQKANNDVSLVNNLNAGIQNMLTVRDKRNAENQTIAAMALAKPNLPIETFFEQGLISRKLYNAYRKAYPKKID